jgi:hypothetical protein
VKIAIYNTDEIFGNGAANDVINFGQQMQDNPPLLYEQHKFPANADPDGYLWADDLNLLTNNINEATQSIDAYPDYVVVVTFGHYYIPIIKTWAISEYNKKVPEMVSFHNLRIQSEFIGFIWKWTKWDFSCLNRRQPFGNHVFKRLSDCV